MGLPLHIFCFPKTRKAKQKKAEAFVSVDLHQDGSLSNMQVFSHEFILKVDNWKVSAFFYLTSQNTKCGRITLASLSQKYVDYMYF